MAIALRGRLAVSSVERSVRRLGLSAACWVSIRSGIAGKSGWSAVRSDVRGSVANA